MTNDQLRRFINEPMSNEKDLAEFIEYAKGRIQLIDEDLVIGTALCCREEFWQSLDIQKMIQNSAFVNSNVGLVCRLLGSATSTPELLCELHIFIKKHGVNLCKTDLLFRLITVLHKRKMVDAKHLLLPRLGWFSEIEFWETAILTFRVCEPSLLLNKKLMFIPRMRSASFRALLDILSADIGEQPISFTRLRKGVSVLQRLKSKDHTSVVLRISWACMFVRGRLASVLTHEMTVLGDRRDLEYIQAAAQLESRSN